MSYRDTKENASGRVFFLMFMFAFSDVQKKNTHSRIVNLLTFNL